MAPLAVSTGWDDLCFTLVVDDFLQPQVELVGGIWLTFEIAPVDDPADQRDAVHRLAEGSTSITTRATG